jgi:hypothetical protein
MGSTVGGTSVAGASVAAGGGASVGVAAGAQADTIRTKTKHSPPSKVILFDILTLLFLK